MTEPNMEWEDEFVEKGAALEHERWGKWQQYMHSKFVEHSDGKGEFVCLPVELFRRWERQIATSYENLTEPEKESDRDQVRPYLPFFHEAISEAETRGYERGAAEERERIAEAVKDERLNEMDSWDVSSKKILSLIHDNK